ncbi:Selenoprotein F, partial [Bienertia sinuspersici]
IRFESINFQPVYYQLKYEPARLDLLTLVTKRIIQIQKPQNQHIKSLLNAEKFNLKEIREMKKMNWMIMIYMTLILSIAAVCQAQQLSSKDCENLGFTGLALCSDCKTFSEYVKDQELVSECLKCCVEDSDDSMSKVYSRLRSSYLNSQFRTLYFTGPNMNSEINHLRVCVYLIKCYIACYIVFCRLYVVVGFDCITYAGAVLEVCMRKLVFYPEIVGFIEEEKDKFPSVRVQYSFNSPPKMVMLDDNGENAETIRIDNWKREHILQFLRGKLKSAAS